MCLCLAICLAVTLTKQQEPSLHIKFPPGTIIMHVKYASQTKMDTTYVAQLFIVIARFANKTYQLADQNRHLLKRRINEDSLWVYNDRKDFLACFIPG